jgi:hypothetical protein
MHAVVPANCEGYVAVRSITVIGENGSVVDVSAMAVTAPARFRMGGTWIQRGAHHIQKTLWSAQRPYIHDLVVMMLRFALGLAVLGRGYDRECQCSAQTK